MPACLAGSQNLEFWLIEFRFRACPGGLTTGSYSLERSKCGSPPAPNRLGDSGLAEKDRVGAGIQVAASCCTDRDEPGGNKQEQRERKSSTYLSHASGVVR
ncbi:hypothetical protein FF011L_45550 [Roseimaritima multifibrata]|uniref:Uncharacterized protein n=1 Tax=Roseimaritima multifibrata TaxID=1930274 RepID=A0A517MLH6_9BACT|nr:hypothetical protein FF011L_45550 [Roseimaritima multifibrata]